MPTTALEFSPNTAILLLPLSNTIFVLVSALFSIVYPPIFPRTNVHVNPLTIVAVTIFDCTSETFNFAAVILPAASLSTDKVPVEMLDALIATAFT